jgi:hypothetical protein
MTLHDVFLDFFIVFTSQVPDLFAQDETSKIIEAVRSKANAAGKVREFVI